jgi:hypothetical protein
MKLKVLVPIVVGVLLAGGVAAYLFMSNNGAKTATNNSQQTTTGEQTTTENNSVVSKIPFKSVGELADCSTYTFAELAPVWDVTFTDDDNSTEKVSEINGPNTKQFECDYNETDSGKGLTFVISYRQYADEAAAKNEMNNVRGTEKYGDTVYYLREDKSGVGDEAFFWSRNRTDGSKEANQQLYVRSSNVVFLLSGVNLDSVDTDYKDKLLASYELHFR